MQKANEPTGTADLLEAVAGEFQARVTRREEHRLVALLPVARADGRVAEFALEIDGSLTTPTVKEFAPDRLPTFCPQRHINDNATFCMNWQTADPLVVTTTAEAREWWEKLFAFLLKQEVATKTRRWPGKEWAHGHAAARAQQLAEMSAASLGRYFEEALASGRLRAERRSGGASAGRFIRVFDGCLPLYSVWIPERRVATQRQLCICCGTRLVISECEAHAQNAVNLALALYSQPLAETAFWEVFQGSPCCGTMKDCPLQQTDTSSEKLAA